MDFFAQQDRSRSKTGILVLMFVLAVALVVFAVYFAIFLVVLHNSPGADFFNPRLFFTIAGVTFGVIFLGSAMKTAALSKGGGYVAESLGGKLISRSTADPNKRKLINVVEEISIASGVPVPPVYLLEEEGGINAFAAGFSPNDAVIGVTRGCCEKLSREELQGVIAHEFSHILNGDMRLNIRLMGFLGGILVLATIGKTILRGSRYGSHRSRSSGKGSGQIMIVALLLLIIGYVGVLVGRLIQSAVSRQREYLADASAVQFTRSTGIADALKKIGGFPLGSAITSPAASEACHMFFGKALGSLFSTHPPLIDRIQKIDPGFKGDFKAVGTTAAQVPDAQPLSSFNAGSSLSVDADTVLKTVGTITPETVAYGSKILSAIPPRINDELQDILGATAVVCGLLLSRNPVEKKKQLDMLSLEAPPELVRHLKIVDNFVKGIAGELRLPILDLAIPALRQMSPDQFALFSSHIQLLIEADSKVTVFEFSLKEVITHRMKTVFGNPMQKVVYKSLTPLMKDAAVLLAALARAGHDSREAAGEAFKTAARALPTREKMDMPLKVSFSDLHDALEKFAQASCGVKRTVFDACSQCVLFDKTVSVSEAELLRAVAYAMDIPVPPFLSRAGEAGI